MTLDQDGQVEDFVNGSGAAYVFALGSNGNWSQQGYLKASNAGESDRFGYAVSLSGDGDTLVVGAPNEDSSATGIDGHQADDSEPLAGAVYVFIRSGSTWTQQAYIKSSNTEMLDYFGGAVSIDASGETLAVGARQENSGATGLNKGQNDNSAFGSGAVYLY